MNIPEGFKLVPVEPTAEMNKEGMRWLTGFQHMRANDKRNALSESFKAMIAAAPTPPQPIYDEEVVAWEVTGGGVRPGVFTFKPGWAVEDPAYTVRELVYAQYRAKAGEVDHE